ncbi:hypothetical protein H4R33_000569 [Dimargaris cristalligena]|nr:hypothetical protein H4R33_000569 [Dimargaris cristalligena]
MSLSLPGRVGRKIHDADFQIFILSVIILFTYGMYIAITTIGGGGQDNFAAASYSNLAVNATAAFFGFFAGGIVNYLGPRLSTVISGVPFALYTGSLLAYTQIQNSGFVIASGALVGFGTVIMWTTQGLFSLTYPGEGSKGMSLGFFHVMYSLSGVIAGAIALGLNFQMENRGLTAPTYVVFIVLAVIGLALTVLLVPAEAVRRSDQTHVQHVHFPGWRAELMALGRAFLNRRMLLAAPYMIITQWQAPYQFNGYNGSLFSIRSRGANLMFYRLSSIVASLVYGHLLDKPTWTVKRRGAVATLILVVCLVGSWIGALKVQWHYPPDEPSPYMDLSEGRYWAVWPIFVVWGFIDIGLNMTAFWLIGCFTSDTSEVSMMTGAFLAWQAIGGTIAWNIDAAGVDYRYQGIITISAVMLGFVSLGLSVSKLPDSQHYESKDMR